MNTSKLEEILGAGGLLTDPDALQGHTLDGQAPGAVALPQTLEEASAVIKQANADGLTLVILGGGTTGGPGEVAGPPDLVLSTKRLDKIIDMDTDNLTVTAQAGVVLGDLQDLVGGLENRCYFPIDSEFEEQADYMCSSREYKGSFLPLDPALAARSTLGGIVAANKVGPRRLKYRLPRDLILGIRFITPTGEIIGMGGKTVKNVSGYDISKLMIGSLGSLGMLAEITIRLLPLPEATDGILIGFDSLEKAVDFSDLVLSSKLLPEACELMNKRALDLAGSAGLELPDGGFAVGLALGGFKVEVDRELADLQSMADSRGATGVRVLGPEVAAMFWSDYADVGLTKGAVKVKAAFLLGAFADFLAAAIEADPSAAISAGIGSGTASCFLTEEGADAAGWVQALRAKAEELQGAVIIEAGSPGLKKQVGTFGRTRTDFGLMKSIKQEIDPNGVCSPGRFVGGL